MLAPDMTARLAERLATPRDRSFFNGANIARLLGPRSVRAA
jgi:hypothetical protein